MKALLCESLTGFEGVKVTEVPEPTVEPRDVLVRIHACGLNFPDALMVQGKYQRKPPLPFSPGCEFSGVVEQLGAEATEFTLGQRVCGMVSFGALAERLAVNVRDLYALPDSAELGAAAAFLYTYSTALYALRERAALRSGDSLLVLGAGGGVGSAAVEIAAGLGARVVAAASSEQKLALAVERGADATLCYPSELAASAARKTFGAQLKELAGPQGFNVIYDPVGGDYFDPALRSIAWQGRYLVIGFAAGNIPSIAMNLPLLKGCQIVGVSWGSAMAIDPELKRQIHRELVTMFAAGHLRPPVGASFSLQESVDALQMLAERRAVGKVVVRC